MPGVALSSLRVGADFDASGYVRGAAQKNAADAAMVASDKARNASLAQADAALAKIPSGMASVSKALLDGYSAGARFDGIVRSIGNSVDRGMGLDRANALLDAAYRKFGLTADAAALAEQGFVSIAPAVDAMNAKLSVTAEVADRAQIQLAAAAKAQQAQQSINAQFGVGAAGNDNSARAADVAAYGNELDKLRARYVPLFAAGKDFKAALDDINQAARVGAISESERGAAIDRTKTAFASQVVAIRGTATATGLAAYQMTNLGYQVNDIVTGTMDQLQRSIAATAAGIALIPKTALIDFLGSAASPAERLSAALEAPGLILIPHSKALVSRLLAHRRARLISLSKRILNFRSSNWLAQTSRQSRSRIRRIWRGSNPLVSCRSSSRSTLPRSRLPRSA